MMVHRAMHRKIAEHEAIDVSKCARDGAYYVLDRFVADIDYCDAVTEQWIWSIGQRIADGVIHASTAGDLYQNPDYECLWLR